MAFKKNKVVALLWPLFFKKKSSVHKHTDADSEQGLRQEMSGIGESLVVEAMIENLQHQIKIGLITDMDTATKAYPELKPIDVQEVFDSLLKKDQ